MKVKRGLLAFPTWVQTGEASLALAVHALGDAYDLQ
jgi:hypothetical protein